MAGLETHYSDGSAPCWLAENYRDTYRRNNGGVCGQVLSTDGHFTP